MTLYLGIIAINLVAAIASGHLGLALALAAAGIAPFLLIDVTDKSRLNTNLNRENSIQNQKLGPRWSHHNFKKFDSYNPITLHLNSETSECLITSCALNQTPIAKTDSHGNLEAIFHRSEAKLAGSPYGLLDFTFSLDNTKSKLVLVASAELPDELNKFIRKEVPQQTQAPATKKKGHISDEAWNRAISDVSFARKIQPAKAPDTSLDSDPIDKFEMSWLTRKVNECEVVDNVITQFIRSDIDEIWEYSSPPDSWISLAGEGGLAIIRNNKLVLRIATKRS